MIVKPQSPSRGLVIALLALLIVHWFPLAHLQAAPPTQLKQRVLVHDQIIVAGQIRVAEVVTAQAGWIAIHRSQAGNPGEVIGVAPVQVGVNTNVSVPIDVAQATATLYILLLRDAGQRGVYEFPGADSPIIVSNPPILAFQVTGLPLTATGTTAAATTIGEAAVIEQGFGLYLPLISYKITLQGVVTRGANLRAGPGLTFAIEGRARTRQTILLVACDATCSWYQLADGNWVSASLVQAQSDTSALLPHITVQ